MELSSASSVSRRREPDTAAERQRDAIAQSNATISRGCSGRSDDRDPGGDGLRSPKGATVGSSDFNATGYRPHRTIDAVTAAEPDPYARSHADAER